MSDEQPVRATEISTPIIDFIGKEAQRGQQWALNTPIAAAAPEVPPPAPATPSRAND